MQAAVQQELQGPGVPAPAPATQNPWRAFFQEQRRQRAAKDHHAAIVLVVILFLIAFRTHRQATPWELLQHSILAGLALFSAVEHGSPVYMHWRNLIAVALRLGTASSTMVAKHAARTLQAHPPGSPAGIIPCLVNILVADHSLLLVFLTAGWPVGSISNLVIQLMSLLLAVRQNHDICDTTFMRQTTVMSGLRSLSPRPAHGAGTLVQTLAKKLMDTQLVEVCVVYTTIIQVVIGFLLPIYFFVRYDSRSALQYAERHNIPQSDRLHRMYRAAHTTACVYGNKLCRLGLLLTAISAMWVVGCMLYTL